MRLFEFLSNPLAGGNEMVRSLKMEELRRHRAAVYRGLFRRDIHSKARETPILCSVPIRECIVEFNESLSCQFF